MDVEQRPILQRDLVAALDQAPAFGKHKAAFLVQQAVVPSDEAALADGLR